MRILFERACERKRIVVNCLALHFDNDMRLTHARAKVLIQSFVRRTLFLASGPGPLCKFAHADSRFRVPIRSVVKVRDNVENVER